jgi:predicted DNA-binding transcriptional regulator AlpA
VSATRPAAVVPDPVVRTSFLPPGLARRVFLSQQQLLSLLGVCRPTLNGWVAAGQFPPPLRLGPGRGCKRWRREAVEAFLAEREAEAREGAARG